MKDGERARGRWEKEGAREHEESRRRENATVGFEGNESHHYE